MPDETSRFPIPASLQDLEREPYNLLPYPHDFDDDDEAARADSFCQLVTLIERGNSSLLTGGLYLFQQQQQQQNNDPNVEEIYDPWMDGERVQAMYTLVRYVTFFFKCISIIQKLLCSTAVRKKEPIYVNFPFSRLMFRVLLLFRSFFRMCVCVCV